MIQFVVIVFLFMQQLSFNQSVVQFKIIQMRILSVIEKQNKYKIIDILILILYIITASCRSNLQNFLMRQLVFESVELIFLPKITLHACNGRDNNYFIAFLFCNMSYFWITTSQLSYIFAFIMILDFFLPKIVPYKIIKENENKELKMKVLNPQKILLMTQMKSLRVYSTVRQSFLAQRNNFPYYVRKVKYYENKDLLILICDDQKLRVSVQYFTLRNLKLLRIVDLQDISFNAKIKVFSQDQIAYYHSDRIYLYNINSMKCIRFINCPRLTFFKIHGTDIISVTQKGSKRNQIEICSYDQNMRFTTNQNNDKLLNHLVGDINDLQSLHLINSDKLNRIETSKENTKYLVLCFQKTTQIMNLSNLHEVTTLQNFNSCQIIKDISNDIVISTMHNYYYFYSQTLHFVKYYHFFTFTQIKSISSLLPHSKQPSLIYGIVKDLKSYKFAQLFPQRW